MDLQILWIPYPTTFYNVLLYFLIYQAFFVAEQQKPLSAVAEATTTYTHLTEAGMLSCNNIIFIHLAEAGFCSNAVAVPNAILGKYPHWFVNLAMTADAMSSTVLCRPYLVS
jgi:hypothetical protein